MASAPARKSPFWAELLPAHRRIIHQRHSYVHIHPVVHPVRTVLAAGSVCAGDVPDRVAAPVAIPADWHCSGRSVEAGLGRGDVAGTTLECAISGVKKNLQV